MARRLRQVADDLEAKAHALERHTRLNCAARTRSPKSGRRTQRGGLALYRPVARANSPGRLASNPRARAPRAPPRGHPAGRFARLTADRASHAPAGTFIDRKLVVAERSDCHSAYVRRSIADGDRDEISQADCGSAMDMRSVYSGGCHDGHGARGEGGTGPPREPL